MDSHLSTTPFGRRTLAHVRTASQALLKHDPPIGRIKGADLTRFRARPFGVGPSMRLCGAHTTAANESTKGSNRDYLASGGGVAESDCAAANLAVRRATPHPAGVRTSAKIDNCPCRDALRFSRREAPTLRCPRMITEECQTQTPS